MRPTDPIESAERIRLKYESLRDIAVKAASGASQDEICGKAVENAVSVIGVDAGAIALYGDDGLPYASYSAGSDQFTPLMAEMQGKLISMLRSEFSVESLFLTFEKDSPHSLFSYPLTVAGRNLGTISGVVAGKRNLSTEEEFIGAISSQLAIAIAMGSQIGSAGADIRKAKTEAIVETAVALNHEINNPLTAVLGNVQLLLIDRDKLDARTLRMLESIEAGALRIKDVTGKLMNVVEPQVTDYVSGVKMVDVNRSKSNPDKK
jgi:hypothetical protein